MAERSDAGRQYRARLPLIGAQISTAGGFGPVPGRALEVGAEVVQVFSSNPRTWRADPPDRVELASFADALRKRDLPLFIHAIYLMNLASPDGQLRSRSAGALAHALVTGALSQASGVVTHLGSHLGSGFERAAPLIVETVGVAFEAAVAALAATGPLAVAHPPAATDRTAATNPPEAAVVRLPRLLIETGAGSGATVGGRLEELAELLTGLPPESGVCLDTAHLFAAGYAVHECEGLKTFMVELERLDLLRRVGLVHLNDSGSLFASRHDRHVNPGEGEIGYEGLARIVRHPALACIPFVLEVPGPEKRGPSAVEVAVIKTMRQGAPSRRRVPAPGAARREGPG